VGGRVGERREGERQRAREPIAGLELFLLRSKSVAGFLPPFSLSLFQTQSVGRPVRRSLAYAQVMRARCTHAFVLLRSFMSGLLSLSFLGGRASARATQGRERHVAMFWPASIEPAADARLPLSPLTVFLRRSSVYARSRPSPGAGSATCIIHPRPGSLNHPQTERPGVLTAAATRDGWEVRESVNPS
jgi:hypothetical protein